MLSSGAALTSVTRKTKCNRQEYLLAGSKRSTKMFQWDIRGLAASSKNTKESATPKFRAKIAANLHFFFHELQQPAGKLEAALSYMTS